MTLSQYMFIWLNILADVIHILCYTFILYYIIYIILYTTPFQVWILLEEKRIPYRIEKINMRSYGDKPADFLRIGILIVVYIMYITLHI